MAQELHLVPQGLFTDPSSEVAPPGALRTANNIVIRRKGIIEPRPGFDYGKALDMDGVTGLYHAISYDGDLIIEAFNNVAYALYWYSDKSIIQDEADATVSPIDEENFRGVQARGNLYLPCVDGVRKLTAALDDEAQITGGPFAGTLAFVSEAAGDAVANGKVVAYRALTRREDANGLITRGLPSGRLLYDNDAGAAQDPTLYYFLCGTEIAGDVVELYRSAPFDTGTAPDDELGLTLQQTLTSTNITNKFAILVDANTASDRGATIYTAPSQEGLSQENARPPLCYDAALFKGSLFFGRTTGPQRITLEVQQASSANLVGEATGAGLRTTTCDTTNGSAVLANIGDSTGVQVGQFVGGANIPVASYVISTAPVTISANATGTTVGGAVNFYDALYVGTATNYSGFWQNVGTGLVHWWAVHLSYNNSKLDGGTGALDIVARSINENPQDAYTGTKGTLVVEASDLDASTFYLWATHSEAYYPVPNEPTYSGGLVLSTTGGVSSDAETRPNGIMWSKRDQPEHVPEENYALIGDEGHPVQRVVATKDALFIFKTDGIWRLSGAGEQSGWRVDEFDLSTRLIRPDCAVEMDGAIYAWTNKGVVSVTDAGITLLSASAIGNDIHDITVTLLADASGTPGAYLSPNPKDNEIIMSVPAGTGYANRTVASFYVFNTKTRAWTVWTVPESSDDATHIIYNPADAKLYLLTDGSSEHMWLERLGSTYESSTDRDRTDAISAVTGTAITISGASGYELAVGDLIVQGATLYRVTAITDEDHGTVDISGLTVAAMTAYESYQSDIEWVAKTAKRPDQKKHYLGGAFAFSDFNGIERMTIKHTSALSTSATSETKTFTRTTSNIAADKKFSVPAAHARTSHYYPEIEIKQAGAMWELNGLSIWYTPMGEKGGGL